MWRTAGRGRRAAAREASRRARGRRRPEARLPSAKVSSRRTGRTFRFDLGWSSRTRGLADGQPRHGGEEFFAGSLWKVSVQAFSDEDPTGRRTLGLFLHRRPAGDEDAAKNPTGHGKGARGRARLSCRPRRTVRAKRTRRLVARTPSRMHARRWTCATNSRFRPSTRLFDWASSRPTFVPRGFHARPRDGVGERR